MKPRRWPVLESPGITDLCAEHNELVDAYEQTQARVSELERRAALPAGSGKESATRKV
jgi:N-dimethylarginine dimethylaminohydrolase